MQITFKPKPFLARYHGWRVWYLSLERVNNC
jgi:hypothetical protein